MKLNRHSTTVLQAITTKQKKKKQWERKWIRVDYIIIHNDAYMWMKMSAFQLGMDFMWLIIMMLMMSMMLKNTAQLAMAHLTEPFWSIDTKFNLFFVIKKLNVSQ